MTRDAPACPSLMPLAESRLEILQVRKLIQCVRAEDSVQIAKLVHLGIPGLVNYQGKRRGMVCAVH